MDERVPAFRNTPASSSRKSDAESTTKVVSGKHSIHTHFPEDRNCEMRKTAMVTRAPCRRHNGKAVPRAQSFGVLMTARNNHRSAIVVQDLATQWIQSYPCKIKTSQETERSAQKILEPSEKPKVIYTDNSLEFGKACEEC